MNKYCTLKLALGNRNDEQNKCLKSWKEEKQTSSLQYS